MGNFASNPILQRTPTSFSTTTNPFGPATTRLGYGMAGLGPVNAAAAQKQEFGRLQGIQALQQSAFSLGEQQRKSQEEQMMQAARERVYKMYKAGQGGWQNPNDPRDIASIPSYYLDMAKREKEMEDLRVRQMQMGLLESAAAVADRGGTFRAFAGGGSSGSPLGQSWSVPSFPS